jgi:superfamily II DNA or RNA helicase
LIALTAFPSTGRPPRAARIALQTYAKQNDASLVHPFMLVVTQDTNHARQVHEFVESEQFFDGRYKGRVIEIHSKLTGEESDENARRLLNIERDGTTDIVIHVNKLKEGWDVANLFTIVPLRASASDILTEQTLGRGLRLNAHLVSLRHRFCPATLGSTRSPATRHSMSLSTSPFPDQ